MDWGPWSCVASEYIYGKEKRAAEARRRARRRPRMEAIELTEASEAERGEGDVLFSREGFSELTEWPRKESRAADGKN